MSSIQITVVFHVSPWNFSIPQKTLCAINSNGIYNRLSFRNMLSNFMNEIVRFGCMTHSTRITDIRKGVMQKKQKF